MDLGIDVAPLHGLAAVVVQGAVDELGALTDQLLGRGQVDKAPGDHLRRSHEPPAGAVQGHHHHHEAVPGEGAAVPQHLAARVPELQAVDVDVAQT